MHNVWHSLDIHCTPHVGLAAESRLASLISIIFQRTTDDLVSDVSDARVMQTQNEVECRFLLDVIVGQCPAILQLLSCEDQSLLIGWNAFLLLHFLFDILDGVARLYFQCHRLTRQCPDEYLHGRGGHGQQQCKDCNHY